MHALGVKSRKVSLQSLQLLQRVGIGQRKCHAGLRGVEVQPARAAGHGARQPVGEFGDSFGAHIQGHLVGPDLVHIDDAVILNGMIDQSRIRAIARLGYRGDYTVVDNIFEMRRAMP